MDEMVDYRPTGPTLEGCLLKLAVWVIIAIVLIIFVLGIMAGIVITGAL